jgi:transcriptional repressor NrdR
MKCPFCGKVNSSVLESRDIDNGEGVRRRRECESCKKRFTTIEKVRGSVLLISKKDGRREPFDRDKVRRGILRSVQKRPVTIEMVEQVVDDVERELLRQEKEEVSSKFVGNVILRRLKKLDKVAWLRFASVYFEFENLNDFEKLIVK